MTHPHDHPAPDLNTPNDINTRAALAALGFHRCEDHAPADPMERTATDLGALAALVRAHIAGLPADLGPLVDGEFHNMLAHLGKPCPCGQQHETPGEFARDVVRPDPLVVDLSGRVNDL